MSTSPWIAHLGQSSESEKLLAALKKVGVGKVPTIKKQETTSQVELKEAMLIFSTGELFPKLAEGGDGSSVLSGVMLTINGKAGRFDGELPYGIKREDSQDVLRARFGEPVDSNEDFYWDEWKVDDRRLRVEWDESFSRVEMVGVELWR